MYGFSEDPRRPWLLVRGRPDRLLLVLSQPPKSTLAPLALNLLMEFSKVFLSPLLMGKVSPKLTLTLSPNFKVEEMEAFEYGLILLE